jgi:chromosome segregation ATPase
MSQTAGRDALLTRRLELVAQVSALTAEMQRLNQKLAGIEMDLMRLDLDMGRSGVTEQLVQDLHAAEAEAAAIRQARQACEERIVAVEGDIEDVDRGLAEHGS